MRDADRMSTGEAVAFAAMVSPARTHMCGLFAFQERREQMKVRDDNTLKVTPETRRRYEAMRYEVVEMHLFDTDATEEKVLCGANTSADDRRDVNG